VTQPMARREVYDQATVARLLKVKLGRIKECILANGNVATGAQIMKRCKNCTQGDLDQLVKKGKLVFSGSVYSLPNRRACMS
jgi:hypothetical protein